LYDLKVRGKVMKNIFEKGVLLIVPYLLVALSPCTKGVPLFIIYNSLTRCLNVKKLMINIKKHLTIINST